MEKRITKKLLAILMIITILATDFYVLGSSLITYASQLVSATSNSNIEFSTYFKNDDGEKVDNINASIKNENLKLYAEIKVKNDDGYLEEGTTIEITDSNFNLVSSTIGSVENNKITLNQINAGETVEIELGIEPIITDKIETNFLSKTSTVKLNGEYIYSQAEDGETISESRYVSVNYQPDETASAELATDIITNTILSVNGENKKVVQLLIKSRLTNNQYPVKQTTLNVSVPQLGEEETEVSVLALGELATNGKTTVNDNYTYDGKNLIITLTNDEENGLINWGKNIYDELVVTLIYANNVDASAAEITTSSEIRLYNSENVHQQTLTKEIGNEELNQVIIGRTEITTEELYKGQLYANATSTKDVDVEYETKTIIGITNKGITDKITIHEGADVFETDNSELAIDTKYKSTKINKEKMVELFGESATIEIKNGDTPIEANEIDGNIVITYPTDKNVSEIEIVITGQPKATGVLEINHVKAITEINDYDRDDIETVKTLNTKNTTLATLSEVKVVENSVETSIELKETISKAELTIVGDIKKLATEETNELQLGVEFITNDTQYDLYSNPVIDIELPESVENVTIDSVDKVYDDNNEFGEPTKEVLDKNNKKYLRITLSGEQKAYPKTQLYLQINLTNITLAELTTTYTDKISMQYTNDNASQYYNEGLDTKTIEISGPGEIVTEFNLTEHEKVSKQQVQEGDEIEFEALLINDTDSNMNDVKILGKLPTEGITIEGKDANTLVTTLKAVTAPNATVYYTENTDATTDINDSTNGWTENLSEVPNAKLYLIELGALNKGDNYTTTIKVQVADTIEERAESYTNYDVICGTEVVKTSKTIGLVTYQVSDVDVELTAQVGQDTLINGDTVKEGEVIKYTATVTNNTGATLENVELKGNIPEGTVLVLPQENYEYFFNYYDEVTDETKIAEETTEIFATIEPGAPYILEYEVRVKTDIITTGITEISNKATAMCNNVESQSKEIKNTIEKSNIRVSIERALPIDTIIFAESPMEYYVYIENLSDKTVENIEMEIVSGMFEITAIKSDDIIYNEEDEIPDKITIDKISANTAIQLKISGKIKDDAEGILQTMAIVTDSKGTYRSNLFSDTLAHLDATVTLSSDRENNSYVEYGDQINYTIIAQNTGDITGLITVTDTIPEYLMVENININGKPYLQKTDKTADTYTAIISNDIFVKRILEAGETIKIDIETAVIYIPSENEDEIITNKAKVEANGVTKDITEEITHILTLDIAAKDPNEPTNPDNPTNPDQPIDPDEPANPEQPTDPEQPIDPEQPEDKNTITGIAWLDANKNGQKDSNETLLSGIKVKIYDVLTKNYLTDNNGTIVETTTNSDGKYTINSLEKGSYILLFEYDTEKYELTTYIAEGVDVAKNSKVVLKKVSVNGEEITAAVTDTINVQEDISDINIGLKEKLKFDLELNKYISKIVIQTAKETKSYNYENTTFAKAEIHRKQIEGSLVVLEYTIKVKNNGEISGYAKNIVDYLPSGLTFSSELNNDWYLSENYLYTKSLENVELQPGEETEVKLILTKIMTSENVGLINNRAEIYQDYNQYGEFDIDSTPNNQVQDEDDLGAVDVIILVSTGGSTIAYIILLMINMVLIGIAIKLMIKNRIIRIPNKRGRR